MNYSTVGNVFGFLILSSPSLGISLNFETSIAGCQFPCGHHIIIFLAVFNSRSNFPSRLKANYKDSNQPTNQRTSSVQTKILTPMEFPNSQCVIFEYVGYSVSELLLPSKHGMLCGSSYNIIL